MRRGRCPLSFFMNKMKKTFALIIIVIMSAVFCAVFSSCDERGKGAASGIEIEDDRQTDSADDGKDETLEDESGQQGGEKGEEEQEGTAIIYESGAVQAGTDVFFGIISRAAETAQGNVLSETMQREIKEYLQSYLIPAFGKAAVSQNEFMKIVRNVSAAEEKILRILTEDNGDAGKAFAAMKLFYSFSVAVTGVEKSGAAAYEIVAGYFSFKEKQSLEKYEKYGENYSFYLEEAKMYAEREEGVRNNIGKKNFSAAIRLIYATGDFSDEEADFSNVSETQITEYLRLYAERLRETDLGTEGVYELLLIGRYLLTSSAADKNLLGYAEQSGDLLVLAERLQTFRLAVSDLLRSVTEEEARVLKTDGGEAFVAALIANREQTVRECIDGLLDGLFSDEEYLMILEEPVNVPDYHGFLTQYPAKDWLNVSDAATKGLCAEALRSYAVFKSPVAAFLLFH